MGLRAPTACSNRVLLMDSPGPLQSEHPQGTAVKLSMDMITLKIKKKLCIAAQL